MINRFKFSPHLLQCQQYHESLFSRITTTEILHVDAIESTVEKQEIYEKIVKYISVCL